MKDKLYNVVVINNKTKMKVVMNGQPMTHKEACTVLSKITKYPWRTEKLERAVFDARR